MAEQQLILMLFAIFMGAAVLSTLALFTRQSMLVAYIALGVILGPFGLHVVHDAKIIQNVGDVGIIFLLFLLGLNLPPQKLFHMLKKVSVVGVISSLIFGFVGFAIGKLFGYTNVESAVIGCAMMFSSTIIGIKLLPTTILHHQHTGEVMISVLLLQDLIAIFVMLVLHAAATSGGWLTDAALIVGGFPLLFGGAYFIERFILYRLFTRFSRTKEYVFLVAIAWCLAIAVAAFYLGLSNEVGAFIAGVTLASSPIAIYIAESLKPVRDFFLIMFFFSVGAIFNVNDFTMVVIPAIVLTIVFFGIKPVIYRWLLHRVGESKQVAWEVGVRLGQISEFSLIIAYMALETKLIGDLSANLIELATILSFIVSSYIVVQKYPTPIATSNKMRRD